MNASRAARALGLLASVLLSAAAASPALAASLSIESGAVVLGKTESSLVTVRVDEPPGDEERPLRLSVNVGSFSEPRRIGPGKYRVTYLPPRTRFPQVALVAVWRETGPGARIDFLRLPLFGETTLPVSAPRGAQVTVEVGLDTFGPTPADARGEARVRIIVPPGSDRARVTIREKSGASVTKTVPVEVPGYNRLTAALVPHAIVADGKAYARLDVFYDLGGAALAADRVRVVASVGTVALEKAGKGLYTYRYVAPAGEAAKGVQFRISVDGDRLATATASLDLGLPAPDRILVRAPQAALAAGDRTGGRLTVLVLDAAGLGLAGHLLEATANGEAVGPPEDLGAGRYEVPFLPPAAYPAGGVVRFEVRVKGAAAAGVANWQLLARAAPQSVRARLSPSPVPADGRTEASLELDVRDAAGMPLGGVSLIATASDGTVGRLEPTAPGRYRASFLPPDALPAEPATLRIVDAGGGFERRIPLPLRQRTGRLLLGGRAGWVHSLENLTTPRIGLDLVVPFRAGGAWMFAGVTASVATTSQTVTDPVSGLSTRSEATFAPVSFRGGAELWSGRRASLALGAGLVVAPARFRTSARDGDTVATGFGGEGFLALSVAAGPGQAFVEASYAQVQVETDDARLPAGGVGVALGYRLRVF